MPRVALERLVGRQVRMSTKADQLGERVIVTGRAYVRMVEAADVLLGRQPVWTERLLLRLTRATSPRAFFVCPLV